MNNSTILGQLEIDHDRGVVYFHVGSEAEAERLGLVTLLRISNLPVPVPEGKFLDVRGPDEKNNRVPEHVNRLRAACKLAMPVLTRWIELQHGYNGPPYVNAKQASDARDAIIAALEGGGTDEARLT